MDVTSRARAGSAPSERGVGQRQDRLGAAPDHGEQRPGPRQHPLVFSEGRLDGEREGVRLTRLSGLGTGAAGVPEMEVVTADGRLLTANA